MNCWEFRKCGREPGGANVKKNGVCPASTSKYFDGCNGGKNAGRACWMVAGTFCKAEGKAHGSFVEKYSDCRKCPFYQLVESEDDGYMFLAKRGAASSGNCKQWYEVKTVSSVAEDEQAILHLLNQYFKNSASKEVRLFNIYKELPIINKAQIIEISGSNIILATNRSQIAAIKACQESFIGLEYFPTYFMGMLKEYDVQRTTITLKSLCYADIYTDFRQAVRVRFTRPLDVIIRLEDNVIQGKMVDISSSGCAVNVISASGLEKSSTAMIKLKLPDTLTEQIMELEVPCNVVRVDDESRPVKIVVRFTHTMASEETLSRFMNQRQLELIKELREGL